MNQGRRVSFRGEVLFERNESEQVSCISKVVSVQGSFCISIGETPAYLDLGKVGYDNEWKDVEFEFEVINLSETTLVAQIENLPETISLLKVNDTIQVEPRKMVFVKALFFPLNVIFFCL